MRTFYLALILLSPAAGLYAQTNTSPSNIDRGQIEMLEAELVPVADAWQLLASAEIQLSPEMRQGLSSGVPLQFIVEIRINKPRTLLPAKAVVVHQQRYRLVYYELTRHYRVQEMDSGRSRNFRSLLVALDELGRLDDIVVPYPDNDISHSDLFAVLNFRLDDKALPLPLQPLFSRRWKLTSEDFAWSLN